MEDFNQINPDDPFAGIGDSSDPFGEIGHSQTTVEPEPTIVKKVQETLAKAEQFNKAALDSETGKTIKKVAETATLGPVKAALDVLDRFNYGATQFFDSMNDAAMKKYVQTQDINEQSLAAVASIPGDIVDAVKEMVHPQSKMRFADLFKKTDPEDYAKHPIANEMLGFVSDMVLNPLNLFSLGAGEGRVIGEEAGRAVRLAPKGMGELAKMIKSGVYGAVDDPTTTVGAEAALLKIIDAGGASARGLVDKGGLKLGETTLIPQDAVGDLAKFLRLDKVPKMLEKLPFAEKVIPEAKRQFSELRPRLSGLDKNIHGQMDNFWPLARRRLLGELGNLKNDAYDLIYNKMRTGKYTKDEVEAVGKLVGTIRDEKNKAIVDLINNGETEKDALEHVSSWMRDAFTPGIIGANPAFSGKIRQGIQDLQQVGNATSLWTEAHQIYKDAQNVRMQSGLVSQMADGYFGEVWDLIKHPERAIERFKDFNKIRMEGKILDPMRRFDTYDEVKRLGYDPETNLLRALSLNYINALKDARLKLADEALTQHFGSVADIPSQIKKDFKLIGSTSFLPEMKEWMVPIYRGVSAANRLFTSAATKWLPRFAVKQIGQNFLQDLLVNGVKGSRIYDMESHGLMSILNALDSHILPKEGAFAKKFLDGTIIENSLGERRKLRWLYEQMKNQAVLKGTDASGTQRISEQLVRSIDRDVELANKYGDNGLALRKFLSSIIRYPMHASFVEDHYRGSLFLNLWKQGKTPFQAAQKVDQTFFDYVNSFTKFENTWVRHFGTLFYSYPRFAIPMVAKIAATHPNRVANLKTAAEDFVRVWSKFMDGRELTDKEQDILPPYKIGQPTVYDEEHQKFRTQIFNNFNPLDIQDLVELNPSGDIDYGRTVQKVALGHVSKALLMPLEEVINKDFFTDRVIRTNAEKNQYAEFKIGKVDSNQLLENVVGAFMAKLPPGHASGYLGQLFPRLAAKVVDSVGGYSERQMVADSFKRILDWTEKPDQNGEMNVYIRPHLAWWATQLMPELSQSIRMARYDNPMEKALDFFFGIPTYEATKTATLIGGVAQFKKSLEGFKHEMKQAAIAGQDSEVIRYKKMIDDLTNVMRERYSQDAIDEILADQEGQ